MTVSSNIAGRPIAVALLVALLASATPARAQDDLPDVYVQVAIEAALYRDQLSAALPGIEARLAEAVVAQLQRFDALDFVDWQAGAPPSGDAHRLTLRMVGIERLLGTEIRIRYVAQGAGAPENDLSDENARFNPVVFEAIDDKFAQDAGRLGREVEQWLETHIDESLGDALNTHFLRFIAVATFTSPASLTALDAGTNRLPLPIRYSAFYPHTESAFRAVFTSSQADHAGDGYMYLRPVGRASAPGFQDDVLVRIACFGESDLFFSYPEVDLASEEQIATHWDAIRSILDDEHLQRLSLFMERYVKDYYPNTDGALAIEEQPGGGS